MPCIIWMGHRYYIYMGVHAASDHGTSSYRVDGCCDNIRMHYARAMDAPGARELPKAGRSNRNDDVESKPCMAWGSPPSASSAQRAQYPLKLTNIPRASKTPNYGIYLKLQ